jgi:hypothetical protein
MSSASREELAAAASRRGSGEQSTPFAMNLFAYSKVPLLEIRDLCKEIPTPSDDISSRYW